MMKQDLKISLPVYKIGYSLAFIVILSCVHSVVYVNEIGPAIDGKMAVLTLVFCADTYLIERQSRRREVFRLYLIKNQYYAVLRRITVQIGYLTVISILAYGMFYWQKPAVLDEKRSGVWNPFSYEFCEFSELTEWKWAAGKIITAVCAMLLLLLQKKILEKRG